MGKYEELEEFPEKQFRRLTGVQRGTFKKWYLFYWKLNRRDIEKLGERAI